MNKKIITGEYYGHLLEITVDNPPKDIDYVPDQVKEEVFALLECETLSGDFSCEDHDDNKISGTWRILTLRHDYLFCLLQWQYSKSREGFISVDVFEDVFGKGLGRHYFEKWEHTFKRDIKKMIWYFGSDSENGQKFLSMLQSEMELYQNENNSKKNE